MRPTSFVPLLAAAAAQAADLTDLPSFLKQSSATNWAALKTIGQQIWNDPELGLDETHAHNRIVDHFSQVSGWTVTPSAYGLPTAFKLEFENRPANFSGDLPVVGFLAEYDALVGIGHACGHNLIALNSIATATFASEALAHYDIPGRIIVIGTPDEENAAGKFKLNNAGAFDDSDIWLMAHPTSASAIQPMNARLNYFATFVGTTHAEAVSKAYDALVVVSELEGKLPGTSSSAVGIENVGTYATNIVQTFISLGVSGSELATVQNVVDGILDSTYPDVSYTAFVDSNGVGLNITGPGGHASDATNGPLVLSIETFKAFKDTPGVSFYLPGNTTSLELDLTVDMRTRYTADLPAVASAVSAALGTLPNAVSHDVKYPALEVDPYLSDLFINLVKTDDYGMTDFAPSTFAPASSDASWLQDPVLDPATHELLSASKVVLHANYRICETTAGALCAFNHEPNFKILAGAEFGYAQTEIVARAEAQIAVQLLADPLEMAQATAIIAK